MQSSFDQKMLWRSRRGMLELDLVLQPFVKLHHHTLTDSQKLAFKNLLQSDDPDLLAWLVYGEEPEPCHKDIIDYIKKWAES